MLQALLAGYGTGLSLIAAIGAQNAFVLRQGLRREHVWPVVLVCAVSDAILILLGVTGFRGINDAMPQVAPAMLWLGVAFLLTYGALRFKAAFKGGEALRPKDGAAAPLGKVLLTCLLFTWANPHVYLDTVVLIGSLSAQYEPHALAFGLAAMTASFSFFAALGFGARALAPIFAKPQAWVVLEFGIGLVMWAIAASLIWRALG